MDNTYVAENLCAERFERTDDRLRKVEADSEELIKMNIRMGEILERHDKIIENHDTRLATLENKPNKMVDKIITAIISVVTSGIVGVLMSLIIKV